MKIIRVFLAIVVVALSGYGLITGTSGVILPYALLFLGILVLVNGIIEFQKRKATAFTLFLAAGFSIFVSIYTF